MTKPTTPLRQRMIEDMAIRNMSPLTQAAYVRAVANFAIHHGVSPDKLTFEDVRKYQVHLIGRGLKVATIIPIMCALRFLYGTTLGLKDVSEQIPLPRKEDTLPDRALTRRGHAVSEGRHRSQNAHHLHHDLCRRPARLRGREAHGRRYQQPAHGASHPPGQRPQGSLRHAVRAAAGDPARLLQAHQATRLLPLPRSGSQDARSPAALCSALVARRPMQQASRRP